jgi:hypothetical protein
LSAYINPFAFTSSWLALEIAPIKFLGDTNTFGNSAGYAALIGVQVEILYGKGTTRDARDRAACPIEDRIRTIQSWSSETLDEDGKIHMTKY